MTQDLLIEIGVEELPSSFVARALEALPELARKHLTHLRLSHGTMEALGTARRLSLLVRAVADVQPDVSEEVLGPPRSAGFDAKGSPTKAAEAFAKKFNQPVEAIRTVDTPKGPYCALTREESGRPTAEVLPAALGQLCAEIPFQKSMRWGAGDVAFGRPVHWIVALLGADVLPVSFAGVVAGRSTRGHRFLAPSAFELPRADAYVAALRDAHVRVDPAERLRVMHEALRKGAREAGGVLVEDPFLMEECLSLVEEPHVVIGGFEDAYLSLPDDVIVAVMRGHQRYFAVRDADGKLLPKYLTVVNTALDPATIRLGNDRVLRGRLADARFFVAEDGKTKLADRVSKLDGIVFQAKLGTVGEKVRRVAALAPAIAPELDAARLQLAASLAKADLVSLIVGEFPELQGAMGRYYALADGVEPAVADAIRDHYQPKGASDRVASEPIAAAVGIADRFDTLVGCFGVGLVPSGSADPFALRRAALAIVRSALEGPLDVDLTRSLEAAHALFDGKKLGPAGEVRAKLDEFFRARLAAYYGDRLPGDVVEACLGAWQSGSIRDLDARLRALDAFRAAPEFAALAVAFKRCFNIAKDAPAGAVDPGLLSEHEEKDLAEAFAILQPRLEAAVERGAYGEALAEVGRGLRGPIDRFFEKVFVMVDDPSVRENRLRLLGAIARTVTRIAHFHLLAAAG